MPLRGERIRNWLTLLEFKVELFNANLTKKCWLKGTVTGSNNEVIATWDI